MRRSFISLLALGAGLAATPSANASFLDTDLLCQLFGCVVVHDGVDYYVYDMFDADLGGLIPVGGDLIPRALNPIRGGGQVDPVITGTLTPASTVSPGPGQGTLLGISTNGNRNADITVSGDTNGFLDADDTLAAFELTERTDVVSDDNGTTQRSFYITSNRPLIVTAEVRLSGGNISNIQSFYDQARFRYNTRNRGTDAGMAYGRRGNGRFRRLGSFKDLGDLTGGAKRIAEFRRAISRGFAPTMAEQSVRFDYNYAVQGYDMSLGAGELNYQIEFNFRRR